MATRYLKAAGGNWSVAGTWSATGSGGVDSVGPPTASDDVVLEAGSGNLTINAAAVCRSLDCTSGAGSYVGTLTHNAAVGLTIGDATAGAGNVALRFSAGMTYTLGSTTSNVTYISTSATQQTISTAGKTLMGWTVNAPGGSYLLSDANTTGASSTVTLTAGALDTNGQTCTWGIFNSVNSNVRTLTLGASSITITGTSWTIATATNATLNAGTSTITISGSGTFNAGTNLSYNNIVYNGCNGSVLTSSGGAGTGTIANLTVTGAASATQNLNINTPIVVTGTLTVSGANATNQRLLVSSNVNGLQNVTVNGSVTASNVDFHYIGGLGSASWNLSAIPGNSGDAGGNTGITLTTPSWQTWQGTSGGNWSDVAKWTSRVPLPQDDIIISSAFGAGQTITADMARLGKSISFVGTTGNPTFANTTISSVYGSLTLVSDMTLGLTSAIYLFTTGGSTLTSAGKTWPVAVNICSGYVGGAGSGYVDLVDVLVTTGTLAVGAVSGNGVFAGRLRTNGLSVTCTSMSVGNANLAGSHPSELSAIGSEIHLTGTAVGIFTVNQTNAVLAMTNSVISIDTATATAREFNGVGLSFGTLSYTVAGSTGQLTIRGGNRFDTLNFSDATNARTLVFEAGRTNTIRKFNVQGTAGKLMSVVSTSASIFTLRSTAPRQSCDYLSLQANDTTGGSWYAGANSVNVGSNTGWIFTAPPAGGGSFFAMTN